MGLCPQPLWYPKDHESQSTSLQRLHEELRAKRYRPEAARRKEIEKPDGGKRPLGIPCVRDRIAQQAVVQVLTPIYDPGFGDGSHGFRPKRGTHTALEAVDGALAAGFEWVVDADVTEFFDTGDHEILLDRLNERIADGSVLKLIRLFLTCGVIMEWGEDAQGRLQKAVSRKSRGSFRDRVRKLTKRRAGREARLDPI